jgi:hypothetical protein
VATYCDPAYLVVNDVTTCRLYLSTGDGPQEEASAQRAFPTPDSGTVINAGFGDHSTVYVGDWNMYGQITYPNGQTHIVWSDNTDWQKN